MISSLAFKAYTAANLAAATPHGGKTYTGSDNAASTASAESEAVTLSGTGKLLSATLLLPTPETIGNLSGQLSGDLGKLFAAAGVPTQPPVAFEVDPNTGHIAVTGDRPDIAQIERLVNGDSAIARRMRDLSALSSHAIAIGQARRAGAATSPAGVQRAIAQYTQIYNGQQRAANITLGYDGNAVDVSADGRPWLVTG